MSVGEVVVPLVAEAMLVTEPESRSAWVIVYDAVQVMKSPGARLAVAGQVSSVALSSLTVNGPDNVTLPVFVTRIAVRDHVAHGVVASSVPPS